MTAPPAIRRRYRTFADIMDRVGDVPPHRIRTDPPAVAATESDLLTIHRREKRLYELVDGILVEKAMGYLESLLACEIIRLLGNHVDEHDLGMVTGPDGTMRLMPGLVRIPDVAFVAWGHVPGRRPPTEPIPELAPDLAVEVLSASNTPKEMELKRREYFSSGARLVWLIDPVRRTAHVFTAPEESFILSETDSLSGGDVLPGFVLPLAKLFAKAPEALDRPARKRTRKGREPKRKRGGA